MPTRGLRSVQTAVKSLVKRAFLGPGGTRPRKIRKGLLRGLSFNVDVSNNASLVFGLYEREVLRDVRRLSRRVTAAVDAGANDGCYSLFFANQPGIERVIAFEPDPASNEKLQANLRLNDPALAAKLTIVSKFLGSRDQDGWCSLDSHLAALPGPTLLKIDVEGGEVDVLRGARQLLAREDCVLVVETHSPALERECAAFLQSLGYRTRIVKNGWYRILVPEQRSLELNRWLIAARRE
jgi:hypothetical protein